MSIRVIIADDHAVVREGIKAVVERLDPLIEIVGLAANGKETLRLAEQTPADVYILDISMPQMNGLETMSQLLKKDPKAKILILSMYDDPTLIKKAIHQGARGYLLKEHALEDIVQAIHRVSAGEIVFCPKLETKIKTADFGRRKRKKEGAKESSLTEREQEVLKLIAEGFSDKQISQQLRIAANTVHVHRNNIKRRLRLYKQSDLIRYALKEKLISL